MKKPAKQHVEQHVERGNVTSLIANHMVQLAQLKRPLRQVILVEELPVPPEWLDPATLWLQQMLAGKDPVTIKLAEVGQMWREDTLLAVSAEVEGLFRSLGQLPVNQGPLLTLSASFGQEVCQGRLIVQRETLLEFSVLTKGGIAVPKHFRDAALQMQSISLKSALVPLPEDVEEEAKRAAQKQALGLRTFTH